MDTIWAFCCSIHAANVYRLGLCAGLRFCFESCSMILHTLGLFLCKAFLDGRSEWIIACFRGLRIED